MVISLVSSFQVALAQRQAASLPCLVACLVASHIRVILASSEVELVFVATFLISLHGTVFSFLKYKCNR